MSKSSARANLTNDYSTVDYESGGVKIEFNDLFQRALDIMEKTQRQIFVTGKAGTGKSTLLKYFREHTSKKVAVLAPTGVAAINVQGETIHSFFGFKPGVTLEKVKKTRDKKELEMYQKIDTIIIDEVSMVRADLMDCVDKFLRFNRSQHNLPFGGVQMIFIGDLYQLPPVVTGEEKELFKTYYPSPYFFDSHVFESLKIDFIELEKIYRQKDETFIKLLNRIRNNSAGEEELKLLNERYQPDYEPRDDYSVFLTTTNAMAAEINEGQLNRLEGKAHRFHGEISGDFDSKSLPTELDLFLKMGAQVMLLNNESHGRWVNGTIGKILDFKNDQITVELASGGIVKVTPFQWEIFHFYLDAGTDQLRTEPVGNFTQYPLKLAWAITIHKSQGKTFDKVIIDIGKGTFAHGQMYVALSRCRSLEGIVLKKKIQKPHIFMDYRVVKFVTQYQYLLSEQNCSMDEKIKIIEHAIKDDGCLEITYLKANDEKSKRIIRPRTINEMEYKDVPFTGLVAYCYERKDERVFRIDRILELKLVAESN